MSLVQGYLSRPALPSSEAGKRIWAAGERYQERKQSADKERVEALLREQRALLKRVSHVVEKERRRKIAQYRRRRVGRPADPPPPITMKEITEQVCEKRGLSRERILSTRRDRPTARARFEIMYRIHRESPRSLPVIGRHFRSPDRPQGMDHTSVLHGIRRYAALVEMGEET